MRSYLRRTHAAAFNPEKVLPETFFWAGLILIALTSLEVQFVPIRSARRQPSFGLISGGDRAACLRGQFAKEGTVIGSEPSWIVKSVLESYVGDRRRCAIGAFEGCLDCRKAPAAQIANGAHV